MRLRLAYVISLSSLDLCRSFTTRPPIGIASALVGDNDKADSSTALFLAGQVSSPSSDVTVVPCEGDVSSMTKAAEFMVDAFWLGSPQQLVVNHGTNMDVSAATRNSLLLNQQVDLMSKYGERLGSRLLESCLLMAIDDESGDILGVVGINVCLLDKEAGNFILTEKAESLLKNTVAALGPKQRRLYKDSPLDQLAADLLPPNQKPICALSNLAVSPSARRRGIAQKLCAEAERLACEEAGFDNMYLKVEDANTAARDLYENKFGYDLRYTLDDDTALRVDDEAGGFVEIKAKSLVLSKSLNST